jgi:hypothetical protein
MIVYRSDHIALVQAPYGLGADLGYRDARGVIRMQLQRMVGDAPA